jgi:hypothetical protein
MRLLEQICPGRRSQIAESIFKKPMFLAWVWLVMCG